MAGKGGGAWKVAYADFVTAMMAFFMVMWITAQNEEVKEAVAQHFQDPFADLRGETGDSSSPRHGREHTSRLGPDEDHPETPGKPRPLRVEVAKGSDTLTGTTIFFAGESAELDQAAKDRLAKLLPVLIGKPQKVEIRGHSSRKPLAGDSPYKSFWELSYARCLTTMEFLEEKGIAPDRMRLSQAGVYEPEASPAARDSAPLGRVEVHLLDEVSPRFTVSKSDPSSPRARNEPVADEKLKAKAAPGGRADASGHAAHGHAQASGAR
ncbi:MAG TPA: flagellar motor protein MotB [Pirellulaceae bacterium]|nr:flagellar motor protein MotB [Pirellulaceae bacterium]